MGTNIKVNNKLIAKISKLAKLKFDAKSTKKMTSDLNIIIGFIDAISKIDTEGVQPLTYMSKEINVLRDDEIKHEISQKDALKNSPYKDSDYFKVPTVLNK